MRCAITIRPARVADASDISAVHIAAWQTAYRGIVPQPYLDQLSTAARAAMWTELIEGGGFELLVATSADGVCGFISFGQSRQPNALADAAELYALYVAPERWSTGVGYSLWRAASARLEALQFASATVLVLAANERAITFYERVGFVVLGGTETSVEIGGKALPALTLRIAVAARDER